MLDRDTNKILQDKLSDGLEEVFEHMLRASARDLLSTVATDARSVERHLRRISRHHEDTETTSAWHAMMVGLRASVEREHPTLRSLAATSAELTAIAYISLVVFQP